MKRATLVALVLLVLPMVAVPVLAAGYTSQQTQQACPPAAG